MTDSEHRRRVEELCDTALDRDERERPAFVAAACGGDEALRQEVEALLAHAQVAETFLEVPIGELAASVLADGHAASLVGRQIGSHKILSLLGAGGMGEVYRARDTKLGRDVAIKVVADVFLSDPERLARLEREARVLATLNHPHIGAIYGLEEADGIRALVLELVEGTTLAERLAMGPLPVLEALTGARQIAEALEAAHEKGIIHRDLKPANIKVTPDGTVKVLDFGLAKVFAREGSEHDLAQMPTITREETREGVIAGTAAYMSPEQARGKTVDKRTDIWAFGCVFYEMLTARPPFRGETTSDTMAAILEHEPDWSALPAETPVNIRRLIQRCLEKDPKRRLRDIGDARLEIEEAARAPRTSAIRRLANNPRTWVAAAAAVVLIAIAAVVFTSRRAPALTARDSLILADFVNTTGEAVFDGTLRQALAVQLEQSPYLHVVGDGRVRKVLGLMGRSAEERLTNAVAREVCEREGVKAMLSGSVSSLGQRYVVGLEATDCRTGDALAREQREASSRENVLQALGQAASALRAKLGESLASVQKFDTPVNDATTSSLEALKAYSLGEEERAKAGGPQSIPFYRKAIQLDPNFALAYARLGAVYSNMGERDLGREYTQRAYTLRDRVSELERLDIEQQYYSRVTGEMQKAIETLELHRRTYPRDFRASSNLAFSYLSIGEPEKALEPAQAAVRGGPSHMIPYANLASAYVGLGRWDEAKSVCQKAVAQDVDVLFIHVTLYHIAFIQDDEAEMRRQVQWASGHPEEQGMRFVEAAAAAYRGKLKQSQELTRAAVDMAVRKDLKQSAGLTLLTGAARDALVGDPALARREVAEALALDRGPESLVNAAQVLGLIGDTVQAQALADEAKSRVPKTDTLFHAVNVPQALSAIALGRNAPDKALVALKPVAPYERGRVDVAYLRGLAHLEAGHGAEAMAEFQKIIDNPGWGGGRSGPAAVAQRLHIGHPQARLGLARAAALAGDTATSRQAYRDFLALWKDADPDVPVLVQAKAEYAKLAGS